MLIYRTYEQLTPIYDNVSGTGSRKLSRIGHHFFNVFCIVVVCLWKGLNVPLSDIAFRFIGRYSVNLYTNASNNDTALTGIALLILLYV